MPKISFSLSFLAAIAVLPLHAAPIQESIAKSQPALYWSFDSKTPLEANTVQGHAEVTSQNAATAPEFPDFGAKNRALRLQKPAFVRIADEGANSRFDFDNGDEFTAEAWVNPASIAGYACILTKGRTSNPGMPANNQNWAFRLAGTGGSANVNFLFRSRPNGDWKGDWHRWTSTTGFAAGSGWHHVAVSYKFGDPKSIRAFVDGREVKGKWDMAGETTQPPVIDDDEVWLGSTMGGIASNSFHGLIDEIALHRRVLPAEELKSRWNYAPQPLQAPKLVDGKITVQLFGPIAATDQIPRGGAKLLAEWAQDQFAFTRLPHRYDDWGIRADWGSTCLVRAWGEIELPPGKHELLLRSRGLSRLWIDDEILTTTPKQSTYGGAHGTVKPLPEVPRPGMRPAAMSDHEKLVEFESKGGKHRVMWEIVVGGPRYRLEFGETCLAVAEEKSKSAPFAILGAKPGFPVTDAGWNAFRQAQETHLDALDSANRRAKAENQADYWARRHQWARARLKPASGASIDGIINRRFAAANQKTAQTAQTANSSGYHQNIEPLLSEHCHRCHGDKQKGGLNLRSRENALKGGDSELPAIVPGAPEKSYLLELVGADAGDDRMPPKGEGLSAEQIATLKTWIAGGAPMPETRKIAAELTPKADDATFLRRAYLDTIGVAPSLAEAKAFLADGDPDKRTKLVRGLLADPRWADNWVGYWQDALAENPNLLKPNLNNTGPFRFWIHEALLDNKPMDRFATELIMMRGSTWGGGAAGFAIASQNDVPMAAKAHVIGSAFLGVEMKCARCHDAPYHELKQGDLFQLAAMLDRKTLTLPETSTVPAAFFEANKQRKALIEVTLTAGAKVAPEFPFSELQQPFPDEFLEKSGDARGKTRRSSHHLAPLCGSARQPRVGALHGRGNRGARQRLGGQRAQQSGASRPPDRPIHPRRLRPEKTRPPHHDQRRLPARSDRSAGQFTRRAAPLPRALPPPDERRANRRRRLPRRRPKHAHGNADPGRGRHARRHQIPQFRLPAARLGVFHPRQRARPPQPGPAPRPSRCRRAQSLRLAQRPGRAHQPPRRSAQLDPTRRPRQRRAGNLAHPA